MAVLERRMSAEERRQRPLNQNMGLTIAQRRGGGRTQRGRLFGLRLVIGRRVFCQGANQPRTAGQPSATPVGGRREYSRCREDSRVAEEAWRQPVQGNNIRIPAQAAALSRSSSRSRPVAEKGWPNSPWPGEIGKSRRRWFAATELIRMS